MRGVFAVFVMLMLAAVPACIGTQETELEPHDIGSSASCEDGIENQGETGLDCGGPCGPCGVCGDGLCDELEDCDSCLLDCGKCPECGDDACHHTESCETCPSDCGFCPSCGDASCDDDEDCMSCPGDCGFCDDCFNNFLDEYEDDMDCGGICAPCPACDDGILNADEEKIDCGGACIPCNETPEFLAFATELERVRAKFRSTLPQFFRITNWVLTDFKEPKDYAAPLEPACEAAREAISESGEINYLEGQSETMQEMSNVAYFFNELCGELQTFSEDEEYVHIDNAVALLTEIVMVIGTEQGYELGRPLWKRDLPRKDKVTAVLFSVDEEYLYVDVGREFPNIFTQDGRLEKGYRGGSRDVCSTCDIVVTGGGNIWVCICPSTGFGGGRLLDGTSIGYPLGRPSDFAVSSLEEYIVRSSSVYEESEEGPGIGLVHKVSLYDFGDDSYPQWDYEIIHTVETLDGDIGIRKKADDVAISSLGEVAVASYNKVMKLDRYGNEDWVYEGSIFDRFETVLITGYGTKVVATTNQTLLSFMTNGSVDWKHDFFEDILTISMSSSGDYIAVGTSHYVHLIYDGRVMGKSFVGGRIVRTAISPSGRYVASANALGQIFFFDCENPDFEPLP